MVWCQRVMWAEPQNCIVTNSVYPIFGLFMSEFATMAK
jgi:hypothetical protein